MNNGEKEFILHIQPSLFYILHDVLEAAKNRLPSSLLNIQKNDWVIEKDKSVKSEDFVLGKTKCRHNI